MAQSALKFSCELTRQKGDQAGTVLVNSQLQAELDPYVKTLNKRLDPKRPLIASKTGKRFSANGLCQRFLQLYDAAGLDKLTSHSGRRTFITSLAYKGVNVRVLAALSRHKNIATTQRYIELNDHVLRERIKRQTIQYRRLQYRKIAA
jgi:integrase/recombinase XerD